ncbi:MAG: alpha/beta hydrolase [Microcella sp.]|uniref:alpha/beta fold hydrolase n=1 Tax=Microcella sp. TaxID=1913979 RepID=UPI0024C820EF|nr:alpha/beta hydrolase [Microcella sp.]UYN84286.1 MAG: alpha/beta hydrolase [Microcella sp.]
MPALSPYAADLARVPAVEHSTEVLGSRTHWVDYGPADAARTVVLVHGFRGDHHGLGPVIAQLPEVRLIAPDLPGFGTSEALVDREHDLEGYTAWLDAFLRATGVHGTAVLLGHSFGSIVVSAAVASGVPTPRVILVNPIGQNALAGPRGVLTRLAVGFYRVGAALPEKLGFAVLRSRLVTRIMSVTMAKTDDRALRRWIHEEHDRYFSAFASRQSLLEAFRTSVSHDVSEFAPSIQQRTLLIAADEDDITPLEAQRRLVTLFPDAALEVIEGVGHLIHYEKPLEAAAAIRRFVA